jgi:glycosyltransferase involved in cell wall biosynthesis
MKQKLPRISVIIPVYNEEDHIYNCLQAISEQIVKPFETIVVDNNSDDQTAAIARNFKSVKVIKEPAQGRAMAQIAGFDFAKGDILARIDADTIVPSNWTEEILKAFVNDPKLSAVTGYGETRTGINIKLVSDIWSWAYFTHTKAFFGSEILWGSNMAMTRQIWAKVKSLCCLDSNLHEDQDISLAIASVGGKIKVSPKLRVSVDFGGISYFGKYWRYNKMKHYTREVNNAHPRSTLTTYRRLPAYKRLFFHLIATYWVGVFMVITFVNSGVRAFLVALKQSSIYFWYQKIREDLRI